MLHKLPPRWASIQRVRLSVPLRGCVRFMQAATNYERKRMQLETKTTCVRVFEKAYLRPPHAGPFRTNVLARTDVGRYNRRHVVLTNLQNLSKLHIYKQSGSFATLC